VCVGLGVLPKTAARALAVAVAVAVGVPVAPVAVDATAIVRTGGAGAGGADDPVSTTAAVPAAVIAATAATRTAIQGHSPHSAFRPIDLPPEASLPALTLQERAGGSSGSRPPK
jgi:hypothetical protein